MSLLNLIRRSALLALVVLPIAASAASVRVVTDVWGGNGNGNIAAGCTTYAPIADLQAFFGEGGLRVLGGNVACGYTGVTADQSAGSGSLLSKQVLPPVALDGAGSSYQGAAGARASFGSLGVSTQGAVVGTTSGTTAAKATGAAFFSDTLTATSPLLAPSAAGFVRYVFSLDGSLSTAAGGSASVALNVRQSGSPIYGIGRVSAQGSDPAHVSAIDSDTSGWLIGAGSASGSGVFGTTIHVPFFGDVDLPMNWGDPWDIEVGLMALSNNTSDAAFMTTARLVDIQLFDAAHRRITDFSLVAASGTDYLGAGPLVVPEPPAWVLAMVAMVAMGLCGVGRARAVRRRVTGGVTMWGPGWGSWGSWGS